jgi:hypothetical protein
MVNNSNSSHACAQMKLILKVSKVQEWHTECTCVYIIGPTLFCITFTEKKGKNWNYRLMIVSLVSGVLQSDETSPGENYFLEIL